ncbi:MAG TPA: hypothetical protein DIV43_05015 [Erysipelotrichaceae bacterium]|nr:hypothetical protein [Erysipelotrichaceae bacterium]
MYDNLCRGKFGFVGKIMRKKTTIKDIACFSKGSQINGDLLLDEGKYEYLNGGTKASGTWNEFNVNGKTITISEGGNSCGYVNFMKEKFWCGAHCYYLFDVKCKPKYLYYLLKGNQSNLMKLRSGACMPNIKKSDLGNFKFIYDSDVIHQDKIISIFDNLTNVIYFYEKQIKYFDNLVKARFVEMFGDYLKEDRRPLSEVAIITGGLTKNSNRNTFETKMPYLRVANVFYNRLDLREILKIGVKEEEIEKTLLQAGDLLFVEGNGSIEQIGRVAIWDGSIDPILHQNHLIKARFNNEIIAPEYALFYFMLQDGRQQIISKSVSTSGLNTLSVNKVSSLLLPIPPIALQKQFSVFVKLVDKSRFDIKKSITEIEREVVYD